jgi:hypothetical protein
MGDAAAIDGAKALAMTALDFLADAALRERTRASFGSAIEPAPADPPERVDRAFGAALGRRGDRARRVGLAQRVMRAECAGDLDRAHDQHPGLRDDPRRVRFADADRRVLLDHAPRDRARLHDRGPLPVGINAVVMDGAVIGPRLDRWPWRARARGQCIRAGSIIAGVPAKVIAQRDSARANRINAWVYHRNAQSTRSGDQRAWTGDEYASWLAAKRAEVDRDADL